MFGKHVSSPPLRRERPRRVQSIAALTLVELISVLGIVAVLVFLFVSISGRLYSGVDRVKSVSNLKALFIAFDAHQQDQSHWPQQPFDMASNPERYEQFYIDTMKPYGITESGWEDPAILRMIRKQGEGYTRRIHYSPTHFDSEPRTPYKWSTMPWLIQIANVHGRGALMIFPDGSVRDFESVMDDQN